MEKIQKRRVIGLVLIIIGLPLLVAIIGIFLICFGLYFMKPPKAPGWKDDREQVKKSSTRWFITGTLIVLLSCIVIGFDLTFMKSWTGKLYRGGFTGLLSILFTVIYTFGVIVILYIIHLNGIIVVWIDFPITLVLSIVAIIQMIKSNEFTYVISWFLVFPLSYIPLLILFIIGILRENRVG
jgi:hypothetical protein